MEEFVFLFYITRMRMILIVMNPLKQSSTLIIIIIRWRPILTPEDILVSIISLLVDPNIESPANVDSSIMYRDKR